MAPGARSGRGSVSDASPSGSADDSRLESRKGPSLPAHIERVLLRLTTARVQETLPPAAEALLDRVSHELDVARASSRGLRGEARFALIGRLAALDIEVMQVARESLDPTVQDELNRQAAAELEAFREQMTPDRFSRAHDIAVVRLIRERLALPTIAFD